MFTLNYALSNEWNAKTAKVDLTSADEMALRYDLFLGDVVIKINDFDLSTNWGWIPLLDFAISINYIIANLSKNDEVELKFDFTESDEFIKFSNKFGNVFISSSYVKGKENVQFAELQLEAARFANQLIMDLIVHYPSLSENISFNYIVSQLVITKNIENVIAQVIKH